jgi:hypothetical protein
LMTKPEGATIYIWSFPLLEKKDKGKCEVKGGRCTTSNTQSCLVSPLEMAHGRGQAFLLEVVNHSENSSAQKHKQQMWTKTEYQCLDDQCVEVITSTGYTLFKNWKTCHASS